MRSRAKIAVSGPVTLFSPFTDNIPKILEAAITGCLGTPPGHALPICKIFLCIQGLGCTLVNTRGPSPMWPNPAQNEQLPYLKMALTLCFLLSHKGLPAII